jgi:hypothetical protein
MVPASHGRSFEIKAKSGSARQRVPTIFDRYSSQRDEFHHTGARAVAF